MRDFRLRTYNLQKSDLHPSILPVSDGPLRVRQMVVGQYILLLCIPQRLGYSGYAKKVNTHEMFNSHKILNPCRTV